MLEGLMHHVIIDVLVQAVISTFYGRLSIPIILFLNPIEITLREKLGRQRRNLLFAVQSYKIFYQMVPHLAPHLVPQGLAWSTFSIASAFCLGRN